jgi:hypothetical protein
LRPGLQAWTLQACSSPVIASQGAGLARWLHCLAGHPCGLCLDELQLETAWLFLVMALCTMSNSQRSADGSLEPLLSPGRQRPEAAPSRLSGRGEASLASSRPSNEKEDEVFVMDDADLRRKAVSDRVPCAPQPGQDTGVRVQCCSGAEPFEPLPVLTVREDEPLLPKSTSRDWNDIMSAKAEDTAAADACQAGRTSVRPAKEEKASTSCRKPGGPTMGVPQDLRSLSNAAAAAAAEALQAMESEKALRGGEDSEAVELTSPRVSRGARGGNTQGGKDAGSKGGGRGDAGVQAAHARGGGGRDGSGSSGAAQGGGEEEHLKRKGKSLGWPGQEAREEAAEQPADSCDGCQSRWLSRIDSGNLRLFPDTPEGHYAEIACVSAFSVASCESCRSVLHCGAWFACTRGRTCTHGPCCCCHSLNQRRVLEGFSAAC